MDLLLELLAHVYGDGNYHGVLNSICEEISLAFTMRF
jgi:hypothetical protein